MTVCRGWHELLIRLADPEDSLTHSDVKYRLAVGTDDVTPQYGNESINQEVDRIDVTDYIGDSTELFMSTFVDSTEANPESGGSHKLREAGIFAEIDGEPIEYLCNHSLIDPIEKEQLTTATIDFTLDLNNDPSDP